MSTRVNCLSCGFITDETPCPECSELIWYGSAEERLEGLAEPEDIKIACELAKRLFEMDCIKDGSATRVIDCRRDWYEEIKNPWLSDEAKAEAKINLQAEKKKPSEKYSVDVQYHAQTDTYQFFPPEKAIQDEAVEEEKRRVKRIDDFIRRHEKKECGSDVELEIDLETLVKNFRINPSDKKPEEKWPRSRIRFSQKNDSIEANYDVSSGPEYEDEDIDQMEEDYTDTRSCSYLYATLGGEYDEMDDLDEFE